MATATINATDTSYVEYYGSPYPGTYTAAASFRPTCFKNNGGANYDVQVGLYKFDTSSLGAGAVITAATLKIYPTISTNGDSLNLNGDYYNWGAAADTTDFAALVGTTAFAVAGTSFSTSTYNSITLSALGNIDPAGTTYIRTGFSGGAPAGSNGLTVQGYSDANPPQLVITYTPYPKGALFFPFF